MQDMAVRLSGYLSKLSLPSLGVTDILEIALISFFIYQFMVWIKFTRAYTLLKGILIVLLFILFAYVLKMNTILWIIKNLSTILLTSVVVIFQPELRKMLEQLGQKKFMASIFPLDAGKEVQERFTDKTINELVKACFDMGEVRTGALIVIEQNIRLSEYERTGINVDAVLTSQLLINIFEHNTPLHDGAVLVRGNRIVAATCYLPLSDNMELSKQLGTRHRAGVGISEVSDSLTIIVSEETGQVSMAQNGQLSRGLTSAELRSALIKAQNKKVVMAAADTFRAAAIEQLTEWSNRVGVDIIAQSEGSDPAAVIYDSIAAAKARHADVLLCDTAGRLQNKKNLMEELRKIDRVIEREYSDAYRENLIVLDATTGQNALSQLREFNDVTNITGIILTKMDGTAKGGIAVAIQAEFGIPVKYVGVGEKVEDLQKFDSDTFVNALFDVKTDDEEEDY